MKNYFDPANPLHLETTPTLNQMVDGVPLDKMLCYAKHEDPVIQKAIDAHNERVGKKTN